MEKLHDTTESIRAEWERLNEAHGYPNEATKTWEQAAIEVDPLDESKAYLDLSGSKHLFVETVPDTSKPKVEGVYPTKTQVKAEYAGKIVDAKAEEQSDTIAADSPKTKDTP